ncbi:MAG TPA: PHB depolymerase family esterase [Candidatus Acidoferrum sp.]|nr:PHB depolymerase family esterase [Candidatus Acidoferrum sp.]
MAEAGWITGVARGAGGTRNFKLWMPRTLEKDKAWPLVLVLHGCTHDAADMAEISGMNEVAEANRFLVVYPEQSRLANLMKCWNWFHPKHQARDAGEPSILAAVVTQVCSAHNVDLDRVYVVGVSAGGAMASILAATYPDLFAAAAVFAGAEFKAATSVSEGLTAMEKGGPDPVQQGQLALEAMRNGLACKLRRRMPVIVFHGTADARVSLINAEQTITQWSKTNACLASEHSESEFALTEKIIDGEVPGGYRYKRHLYLEADARLLMEKWIVQGLGHAWSGSPKPSKYGDPKGPNASTEIWRFFCEAGTSVAPSLISPNLLQPGPSERSA